MPKKRAQVSQEFIAAAGILLLFFALMMGYYYARQNSINDLKSALDKRHDCLVLASAITGTWLNEGSEIEIEILHDAEIRGSLGLVRIEEYPCPVPVQNMTDRDVTKGTVKIENNNSIVEVSNA